MAKNNLNWLLVVAVVVVGYVLIAGNPFATEPGTTTGIPVSSVQCNKDFSTTVPLLSRNEYAKAEAVDTAETVTYKVWKLSGGLQIPQADLAEGDDLTVKYGEEFLVVATNNGTADTQFVEARFAVDEACNAPAEQIFYMKAVPSTVDATFENSKITGPNAADNLIPIPQDVTRTAKATFNGESKTAMDAIIVFDVDKNIIADITSDAKDASVPQDHTTGAGEKSYAFELGEFEQSADVVANFDFTADDAATIAPYNASYTIYSYQTGYENTKTGDWISGSAIEDNDDNVLLPTYTGTVYLDITA